MSSQIASMFSASAHSLKFPADAKDRVHRYVRAHKAGVAAAEHQPFRRQLDLWGLSIAVACAKSLPIDYRSASKGSKFVDTRAVQLGPELSELLVVLAASDFGTDDARLNDPGDIIDLANCYAAAGVSVVLSWLEQASVRQTNIEKILTATEELRGEATTSAGIELGGPITGSTPLSGGRGL